jgi:RHS repeat-associated protein
MYKKIILFITAWMWITLCFAATDYVSLSNNLAAIPGVQSKTQGYDLLSGKVSQDIPLVNGSIPFSMKYQGTLRFSSEGGLDYYQNLDEGGVADWINEYSGYMMTDATSVKVGTVFIIQLPGSVEKYFLINLGGKWKRIYYSGSSQTPAQTFLSEDLRDITFLPSLGSVTVIKDGVTYVADIAKNYNILNKKDTLLKFSQIKFQDGKQLKLSYDNGTNLIEVKDYKKVGAVNQSALERKLITGVELVSGSNVQRSTITYQESQVSSIMDPTKQETQYTIASIESSTVGKVFFNYENLLRGYLYKYIFNNFRSTRTQDQMKSAATYPIINKTSDEKNNILREWSYGNIIDWDNSINNYYVYATQITSFSTLNGKRINESISYYDDLKGIFTNRFLVNGQQQSIDMTMDASNLGNYSVEANLNLMVNATSTITLSGNYPGLVSGSTPIRSMTFNPFTHRIMSMKDFNGNTSKYEYDSQNRLFRKTEALDNIDAQVTTYNYKTLSNGSVNRFPTPNEIITESKVVTNIINPNGWIVQQNISYPKGGSSKNIAYSYFSDSTKFDYGLISNVDGPSSDVNDNVSFTYDSFGNKATFMQIVNNKTVSTKYLNYNTFGQPERIVYPSGLVEQFIYNADGTLQTKVTGNGGDSGNVSGAVTSYTYDYFKRKKSETNPDGETTVYEYDTLGRLVKTITPDGSITSQMYFDNDVIKSTEGTSVVYNEVDTQGRISKTQTGNDINSYWKIFTYDGNGNITQTQTALGIIEKWTYDALNRNITYTDGEGKVSTKTYDKINNLTSSKDSANSGSSPFNYISSTLVKDEVNNDYATKSYIYNQADQITSKTHGGRSCSYSNIDSLGRTGGITCTSENSNDPALGYNYQYTYDGSRFGRLDRVASNTMFDADTQYNYDNLDRITGKTQTNKSLTTWGGENASLSVGYGYSAAGKVNSITMPSGRVINYNYDSNKGRLDSINIANNPFITNIAYDNFGQLTSWNIENTAAKYLINYDSFRNGAISEIAFSNKNNMALYAEKYGFDKDGRVTSINLLNGVKNSINYSNGNRVISESKVVNTNTKYTVTHEYFNNGNKKAISSIGETKYSAAAITFGLLGNTNRLSNISRSGNVTAANYLSTGELRFAPLLSVYDGAGQMRYSGGTNGQYYMAYNHKNERTVRSFSTAGSWYGGAIQYIYDENSNLIGEYASNGTPIVEYVWMESRPVAAIYGSGIGKVYAVITDPNATPRMLVDNSTGAAVWQWESTAFGVGQPVGSVTFNLRFPGQYYDAFTGLHYNLNRYYNPELGRYMEPDPIGLEGGLNPYVYADNNPISNVDPTGLDCIGGSCSTGFEQGMYNWWPGYKFGTGLYNSFMSSSNQFSFWEGIDGAASFLGGAGKGASWAVREADDAISAVRFAFPELKSIGSGAVSASQGAKLSEYYRQLDKFGGAGVRELQSGKYRFYGELTPARTSGEMVGARLVREWNPMTNMKRTWYETLDHAGRVRSVAPKPVTESLNHRIFDINGKYVGRR